MSNEATVRWTQVQRTEEYQGYWVALDNCKFDPTTRQPTEGDVVDSDQDLTELCRRMREMGRSSCSVLFCSGEVFVEQPISGDGVAGDSDPSADGISAVPPRQA